MSDKLLYRTTSNPQLKRGYVDTADGQIHFGTAGEGPALVLIHQSSSSMEEYAALVPYLFEKYQLIMFDLPGHGLSSDPSSEPGVEEFTDVALAVVNHLNVEKCSVLGHHGGALMTMNFAYRFPERTEKVILSGTSGIKSEEEKVEFSKSLENKKKVGLGKDGQSLLLAWQRYVAYMPDAEINDVLRPFLNSVITRMRPYDAHHSVLKWDRQPALENLKVPVLLLQGLLDEFVSHQENLLDIIPNAERQVIEDGGAFLFFDKAKKCAKIIDTFLSK
ncbi:alpha/beta hydrolase [Maribacter algarum]|uniref:Alpha/beta hydrolase n=1 Tax=Maribacter algarum (ex Zhang et al. 2020) TaxID=2578118 RepID=A0A5S3PUG0_9FLAO|nr:alpha/beta hydrolase [Maribacter algarum]TMM58641.1 alpha/beta hydrolase [Maribacter algarum]